MVELKLRKIGNSLGVTLPQEAVAHLGAREGDRLFLVETPEGYQVTAYDPLFARKMEVAESLMARYRNTLRELAR
jgi:putative addiction module antidote